MAIGGDGAEWSGAVDSDRYGGRLDVEVRDLKCWRESEQ
jgi:hypothetical protein